MQEKRYSSEITELLAALKSYAHLEPPRSLPAAYYTSETFFQMEMETLFRHEWICVGRVEEIPQVGDFMTLDIAGEPLLISRDEQGMIHALSNVCRHRGMPIAQERSGHTQYYRCPYHSWRYALDGTLRATPLLGERDDIKVGECRLPEFLCEQWHGWLYVNLDQNATPLAPRLEGLSHLVNNYHMEDMALLHCREEVWPCNWKSLMENFMEGYHLSTVHKDTIASITPTRLCKHFPAGLGYFGYYSHFPDDYPQRGIYHPDLTPEQRNCTLMFSIPINHVAALSGHMTTFLCLMPKNVQQVRVKLGLIFSAADEVSDENRDAAIDLFERTMIEDKQRLIQLHRGLDSRHYHNGPLAPTDYEGTVLDMSCYVSEKFIVSTI